jgi:hypothetical protein
MDRRGASTVPPSRWRRAARGWIRRAARRATVAGAARRGGLGLLAHRGRQLLTWFGTSGSALLAHVLRPAAAPGDRPLARVARRGQGQVTALTLAGALVAFNLLTHVAFVRARRSEPGRPSTPSSRGWRRSDVPATARQPHRQVISFESAGRIVCADYSGPPRLRLCGQWTGWRRRRRGAGDASQAARTGSGGLP